MNSKSYILYAFLPFKTIGYNGCRRSAFENKYSAISPRIASRKTHTRKLSGVEKGLYRLNFNSELQYRFLLACDAQAAAIRRA